MRCLHFNAHLQLIEYSDNYSDTSGSLWEFKRDEVPVDNNANLSINNSRSLRYKAALVGKQEIIIMEIAL